MADQAEKMRGLMNAGPAREPGGEGGVGKTNIAITLALAYSQLGKRVVVMDADLGLANVNVVLGVIPRYNLYHLIRKQKTLNEIIVETAYGIRIIAGASGF